MVALNRFGGYNQQAQRRKDTNMKGIRFSISIRRIQTHQLLPWFDSWYQIFTAAGGSHASINRQNQYQVPCTRSLT